MTIRPYSSHQTSENGLLDRRILHPIRWKITPGYKPCLCVSDLLFFIIDAPPSTTIFCCCCCCCQQRSRYSQTCSSTQSTLRFSCQLDESLFIVVVQVNNLSNTKRLHRVNYIVCSLLSTNEDCCHGQRQSRHIPSVATGFCSYSL